MSIHQVESQHSAECWSCGSAHGDDTLFFCNQCGAIQAASDTADYFQLLGVEPTFMVNLPVIEGKYKALQRKLHPDMYATKQKVEQDFSADQSSLVNKAYATLVNPLSRAIYLLRLRGIEAGDGEEGTMSDFELLSEVMEIREAIEEAEDIGGLQKLHQENAEKMRQSGAAFAAALQAGELQQALEWVHRMTYWDRIDKEITRKL
ncbi:DnaJ heat shock family protein [Klebsormidium nitens]|uniref:DnaJ heat shock family protein n=1 Tax=Klebsormidium nitens TaxID=105231 RepID=A0A1Y1HJM2_KLENI|nr:DnaJ heat shock family protein [Klebsormidium nitens]|eukprot:GAQ78744.1 DnaJ heat shock family protein [Klebsormidium nitens]